ncbi:MAG: Transcriptional regulatory protein ZraR [candidate division BRC1 bacterium ADurb.BinA364]|nr:MAG: Transcriptional regulatory protein ZraR [candidate division BRC1 bacterium ADurb.BinA364]
MTDTLNARAIHDPERRRAELIGAFHGILGQSEAMLAVFRKIELYGPAEGPVLITGETGSGKELIARALHARSRRRSNAFIALNCTALNEDLFESELFGHERGSFTGALRTHRGRFERAHEGTLFLDEIGDMSMRVQAKMLRAIEEGVFERVGGEEELRVDARLLSATNVSLEEAVAYKRFRADLYHRIAVFRIHVPPLRERHGDLPLLAQHILRALNERYRREVRGITPDAMRRLEEYAWPGNVRELRNVLERVYVESQSDVIGAKAFDEWERERESVAAGSWDLSLLEQQRMARPVFVMPGAQPRGALPRGLPMPEAFALGRPLGADEPLAPVLVPAQGPIDIEYTVERNAGALAAPSGPLDEQTIRAAFERANGNATLAARLLGRHKTTLYRAMKRLGLTRDELEKCGEGLGEDPENAAKGAAP